MHLPCNCRAAFETDIDRKPGTNKIVVFGLSPTVEEDSIRVEGSGSSAATITDIAVEPLPNREIFEDVYPESDDSSSEEESESDEDYDEEERDEEGEELEAARAHLTEQLDRQDLAKEAVASATWRLKILDAHGKSVPGKKTMDIEQFLDACRKEREKACDAQLDGIKRQRSIAKDVDDARYRVRQLERKERKSKRNSRKEKARESKQKAKEYQLKAKVRAKKARAKTEERKERARVRMEREKFWPRFCYSVCITLEVNTLTPLSSRRSSVSSETTIQKDSGPPRKAENAGTVQEDPKFDILISYVTGSAGWLPCYDLQLSTTNATGVLCFDAKLRNLTSETWSNCTFALSTSQTTFFERDSSIPVLQPWRIQIAPKGATVPANGILRNREEHAFYSQWQSWKKTVPLGEPREKLFGVPHEFEGFGAGSKRRNDIRRLLREEEDMKKQAQQFTTNYYNSGNSAGNFNKPVASTGHASYGFGQKQAPAGAFGTTNTNISANTAGSGFSSLQKQTGGVFGSSNAGPPVGVFGQSSGWTSGAVEGGSYDVSEKAPAEEPEADPEAELETELAQHLDAEDSLIEETGFTTTFDLPGTSSLVPRSTASKRRVARITFSNVTFSHTVVAKYKPVAFLKASFRNASKLTLLRGQATLILDGSFMGRAWVPRCSAGDRFSLSLGADPAIRVVYPKPDVRRATTGLFNRENSSVYVRTVSLHNTRASAGKPTSLLVLDQIPISQDERLKVELVSPRGLSVDGGSVPIEGKATDAKEDKNWGRATAELGKSGEVNWRVTLNAGKAVKLSLEYAVSLPTGENAIQN